MTEQNDFYENNDDNFERIFKIEEKALIDQQNISVNMKKEKTKI